MSLGSGKGATPGLELGAIKSISFRSDLKKNGVEAALLEGVESFDNLLLLSLFVELGRAGEVDVPDAGDPGAAQLSEVTDVDELGLASTVHGLDGGSILHRGGIGTRGLLNDLLGRGVHLEAGRLGQSIATDLHSSLCSILSRPGLKIGYETDKSFGPVLNGREGRSSQAGGQIR